MIVFVLCFIIFFTITIELTIVHFEFSNSKQLFCVILCKKKEIDWTNIFLIKHVICHLFWSCSLNHEKAECFFLLLDCLFSGSSLLQIFFGNGEDWGGNCGKPLLRCWKLYFISWPFLFRPYYIASWPSRWKNLLKNV